ncbi:MAG: DUF6377 domain-containing protein [Lentimicrobium sp.]|jgi:tetratricopeptide (TPR) repeat protein|nr:DUF6377 domain-containing protein [Lentimicrobium sp.]
MFAFRKTLFSVFLLCSFITLNAQQWSIDSALKELDVALVSREVMDLVKMQQVQTELVKLQQLGPGNTEARYKQSLVLFDAYKSFRYDSAFKYAMYQDSLARTLNDEDKIVSAKINMGFIFLSSGLFKEAIDTLKSIDPDKLNKDLKIDYYSIFGRTYHDLADYNGAAYFTGIYNELGNNYIHKAMELVPPESFQYQLWLGSTQLKANQLEEARQTLYRLFHNRSMTEHQRAITASTLGYIYSRLDKPEPATYLLAIAAISDIKSATKETVALRNLALLLYESGKTERAYAYIKIALEDADFYNARHRKKEVGNVLPIIEGQQIEKIENQKTQLIRSLTIISILGFLAVIFLIISTYQFFKLKKVKELLQLTNGTLTTTNKKLHEANRIKEKYIGYYFNINANYLERIEKIQKTINRRLSLKQYDELHDYINHEMDSKKELDELNQNFDKLVLSLFPNFVNEFNKLFEPEDQFHLKDGELLNKELRIFALLRMGISDNEKIARILNYSVNTIYTYKTKIKNRSIVPNDEFEDHLMQIDG